MLLLTILCYLRIVIILKEYGHWIHYCELLNVSGYGSTEESSEESFKLNARLLFDDAGLKL